MFNEKALEKLPEKLPKKLPKSFQNVTQLPHHSNHYSYLKSLKPSRTFEFLFGDLHNSQILQSQITFD